MQKKKFKDLEAKVEEIFQINQKDRDRILKSYGIKSLIQKAQYPANRSPTK